MPPSKPSGPSGPPRPPGRAPAPAAGTAFAGPSRPAGAASNSAKIRFEIPEDLIGHTLNDRYKILDELGSGGMGTVYLAEHVLINKRVAIKVLSPTHARSPDEVERFLREARAASRIRQENVVDITDFGYTGGGLAFLVMEYLEGEDLGTTSHRDGALPWRRAVRITRQICAALAAAHAQGIIHRDVKPENVFRVRRGEDEDFIKVLDFGIAKIIDEQYDATRPSSTSSGLIGTPEYVAPELIRGLTPDHRVDIYAVGVILYRLITGDVPFTGDTFMATLTQHLMEPPRSPRELVPDLPEAVAQVCLKSLAKDREHRYASIREMSQALAAAEAEAVAPPEPEPTPPASRRGLLVLAALVGLIFVAAVALWAYNRGREVQADTVARAEPPAPAATAAPPPAPVVPAPEPTPPETPPPEPPPVAPEDPPVEDPAPPEERDAPRPGAPRVQLPDKLSLIELRAQMDRAAGRVKTECARYALSKMSVGLKIRVAASGKVVSAAPTGSQMGGLAACVAKVARTVKYRRARQGADFEYTFRM
jgi:serine/threonine-protein kinase